mgnify:CR=1 FL=1
MFTQISSNSLLKRLVYVHWIVYAHRQITDYFPIEVEETGLSCDIAHQYNITVCAIYTSFQIHNLWHFSNNILSSCPSLTTLNYHRAFFSYAFKPIPALKLIFCTMRIYYFRLILYLYNIT